MTSLSVGAMVLDAQGAVVHATGLACDEAVQRSMCALHVAWKAGRCGCTGRLWLSGALRRVELLQRLDSDILLVYDDEAGDSPIASSTPTDFHPSLHRRLQ